MELKDTSLRNVGNHAKKYLNDAIQAKNTESIEKHNRKPAPRIAALSIVRQNDNKNSITIDSGAANHIAHRKDFFITLSKCAPKTCEAADGRQISATQSGIVSLQLTSFQNKKAFPIILKSAYYIPDLEMSVVSVHQLVQAGISLHFRTNKLIFRDMNDNNSILGFGFSDKITGLYSVNITTPQEIGKLHACSKLQNTDHKKNDVIWHQ